MPATAHAQSPAAADAGIEELVRIIENDETRAALIERLRQGTEGSETAAEVPPDLSIVRQLAEYTKAAAEGASATLRSLGAVFVELQRGLSGTQDADLDALRDVALGVLLVGLALFGSFLLLRPVLGWAQRVIAERVAGRGWLSRLLGRLGATLVDFG